MSIIEHNTLMPFAETISCISPSDSEWGFAAIKRHYLRAMTNEAFHLAVRPILQGVAEAHIAYGGDQMIYIAWSGKQKVIYKLLRNLASTSFIRPGLTVDAKVLVTYMDPALRKKEILSMLASEVTETASRLCDPVFGETEYDDEEDGALGDFAFSVSSEQIELYQEACGQKSYRRQLHILVAEDQIYSQKLLLEILRGVRVRNNNESPIIDTVPSVREAWKIFLKKAPDIAFIDLNLSDGSGHTLTRAIKELDPQSQVIIVTANNFEEEMHVARQNNVDGFITKPYNKKQILGYIGRYIDMAKSAKGTGRGSPSSF